MADIVAELERQRARVVAILSPYFYRRGGAAMPVAPPGGGDAVPIGSLNGDFAGPDLHLWWSIPSGGEDIKDFRVQIFVSAGGALYRTAYVRATKYDWPIVVQREDVGAALDPSVYVEVASRNYDDDVSSVMGETFTNPAPGNPTNTSADFSGVNIVIEYEWPDEEDILEVQATFKVTI